MAAPPPARRPRSLLWLSLLLTLVTLLVGGYCLYRAAAPIAGLYAAALNDPMGDADRRTDGPSPQAVRDEAIRWAAIGLPAVLLSGVLGTVVKVMLVRRWLGRRAGARPPVPAAARPARPPPPPRPLGHPPAARPPDTAPPPPGYGPSPR